MLLGIFLFRNPMVWKQDMDMRRIFIRSLCIAVITAFFAYIPYESFRPYRSVIALLNRGDVRLLANIDMFDYSDAFEKELKAGNCEKALQYAKDANLAGRIWVGLPAGEEELETEISMEELEDQDPIELFVKRVLQADVRREKRNRIGSTYENLYLANRCKGQELYNAGRYEEALIYFKKSSYALKITDHEDENWRIEETIVLHNMARCYFEIKQNDEAIALMEKAIEKYIAIKGFADAGIVPVIRNLSRSYEQAGLVGYAERANRIALKIIGENPQTEEERYEYVENYQMLALNLLKVNDIEGAVRCLQKAEIFLSHNSLQYADRCMLEGLVKIRIDRYAEAEAAFRAAMDGYTNLGNSRPNYLIPATAGIAKATQAQGKYRETEYYLEKCIPYAEASFGENSTEYATVLTIRANLYLDLARYGAAADDIRQVIKVYKDRLPEDSLRTAEAIMTWADIQLATDDLPGAKRSTEECLRILGIEDGRDVKENSYLQNSFAYAYYCTGDLSRSEELYRSVLTVENDAVLKPLAALGTALNGLGLVYTEKNLLPEADSCYRKALSVCRAVYTERHPQVAVLYMNQAQLRLKQNRPEDAEQLLKQALEINQAFLPEDHDAFGDAYKILGDIRQKQKRTAEAKTYYIKARTIYKEKFGADHIKTRALSGI